MSPWNKLDEFVKCSYCFESTDMAHDCGTPCCPSHAGAHVFSHPPVDVPVGMQEVASEPEKKIIRRRKKSA